jgi:hypothetical protein
MISLRRFFLEWAYSLYVTVTPTSFLADRVSSVAFNITSLTKAFEEYIKIVSLMLTGNYNRTGRNIDAVCRRIDTDNGDCRYQCRFKGGTSENR